MSVNSVNNGIFFTGVENIVQFPPIASVKAIATIKNPTKIVKTLMKTWKKYNFYDTNLWNCFRKIFEFTQLIEKEFKKMNKLKFKKFRKFLRQRGVWINRELSMPIWKTLLNVIKKNTQSTWFEWEIRNCDETKRFTFSAIRGFLDYEAKRKKRAEAAKTRHSKNRHEKEYSRPPSRHDKEYSPISFVAPYRKVPAVSTPSIKVQHVQISSVQKVQTFQPMQQFQTPSMQQVKPLPIQPSVESTLAFAPAVEPALAFASVEPAPSAAISQKLFKFVLSFSVISEISILSMQPSSLQQQQSTVSISFDPTYIPAPEMSLLAFTSAPQIAFQQPPPPTPQRVTYTTTLNHIFISTSFLKPTSPQTAVLGCIFYKKKMG